ncbi:MAG: hypothetical protein RLN62_06780 [Rickettsiales bacterium]
MTKKHPVTKLEELFEKIKLDSNKLISNLNNINDVESVKKHITQLHQQSQNLSVALHTIFSELSREDKAVFLEKLEILFYNYDKNISSIMKKIYEEYKSFDEEILGKEVSRKVWSMITQSISDWKFKESLLHELEKEETKSRYYPALYDNIMLKKYGKQKFGTQLRINEDGSIKPFPLENPKKVDEYRKEYGLEKLENYLNEASRPIEKKQ